MTKADEMVAEELADETFIESDDRKKKRRMRGRRRRRRKKNMCNDAAWLN